MRSAIALSALTRGDCDALASALRGTHLERPASQIAQHVDAAASGLRVALIARLAGAAAGYGTLDWRSDYPPFREHGIPEIGDLNVVPAARRQGVASRLLDALEARAAERSDRVGIGFGLYRDYGAAQRLYVTRGYVPDGRGVYSGAGHPPGGTTVRLDDDLVLFLTRTLRRT